jgi:hypothetical protein
LKRLAFALFGAVLVYLTFFVFAAGHLVWGGVLAAALIAFIVLGASLEKNYQAEQLASQVKLYAEQAKWSGSELILKPKVVKRLILAMIGAGLSLACLIGVVNFWPLANDEPLLLASLIAGAFVFTYPTWLTLAGFFREILAGYALKLDSSGFTLAGHPTIPWSGVYRAGHMTLNNNGTTDHFLDLEFSAEEIQANWRSKIRPFLIGPLAIAWPILRRSGKFKLRETLLTLPVPTIVTAICQIGSRYAPHPVVELRPHESLEDARQLAVLWNQSQHRPDSSERENVFANAIAGFSKKGGVVDSAALVAAMTQFDQDLPDPNVALQEYSELQRKLTRHSSEQLRKQKNRSTRRLTLFFVGIFLLAILYKLLPLLTA